MRGVRRSIKCISVNETVSTLHPTCVERRWCLWCFPTAALLTSSAPLSVCWKHPLCGTKPHSAPPENRLNQGTTSVWQIRLKVSVLDFTLCATRSDLEGNFLDCFEAKIKKRVFPREQLRLWWICQLPRRLDEMLDVSTDTICTCRGLRDDTTK